MLGCGILRREVMNNFSRDPTEMAWASGCGLGIYYHIIILWKNFNGTFF